MPAHTAAASTPLTAPAVAAPVPAPAPRRGPSLLPAATALVLLVAIALRLRQYLYGRSLWVDEAFLALNIAERSFAELARPLGWDQTAPILFLWLERASVLLFGTHEQALRALPLLVGIAVVPAVYALAAGLLGRVPGLVAAAAAAISPLLVRYANEVESYGVDALTTAVLALLTRRVLAAPRDGRAWLALGAAGVAAVVGSTPSVFVLAGVGLTLLAAPDVRRAPRGVARTLLLGAVWVAFFGVVYVALLRAAAGSEFLRQFFAPAFLSPSAPDLDGRLVEAVWRTVHPLLFPPALPVALKLLVVGTAAAGLVTLARRHGAHLLPLFVVPFAAAFAAAVLEQYPIIPRTMLFAAPLLITLLVAGGLAVTGWLPRALARPARALAAAALLAPLAVQAVRDVRSPWHDWDVRPVVQDMARRGGPHDPVYVSYYARPGYAFYTTNWAAPDRARLTWLDLAKSPRAPGDRTLPDPGDGSDPFARSHAGRTEIVERLPPGLRRDFDGVARAPTPAPAWADGEARRLRPHANPYLWVLNAGSRERLAVVNALERLGGRVVYRNAVWPNMYLYRLRFD